ncbi:MAG: sigma-70 family RNA polymerase sigma factor [Planctomycetota bacterium]|jgi:RNA polymerase sigma-70 factor (ECF subfamily)|nr:sigma-70 family RNA polymerase sigma factor [Planctomycetota bacterium]
MDDEIAVEAGDWLTEGESDPAEEKASGAELLTRIAKGDEKALEGFYRRYFARLYRFVYYRVGRDHQHTEEVIQDTFMEAVEKAGQYNVSRGSVESWLIVMSRNRIRSNNALMARPHEYEKAWDFVDGELDDLFASLNRGDLPEAALDNDYLRTLIGAIMGSIPREYSRLLEMKYMANLSVREISKSIHKTEKAVDSQLNRARNAFREAFKAMSAIPAAELGL